MKLQETYPEISIIRYEEGAENWKKGITRALLAITKIKEVKRIHCEGNNAIEFETLKINGFEFRSLVDCRQVFMQASQQPNTNVLRDRDYLVESEVLILKNRYPNMVILDYYCYENYLYHPDNLNEAILNFNKIGYIDDLLEQKNSKKLNIALDLKGSRNGYPEFTQGKYSIKKSKDAEEYIIQKLSSNEFEDYYPLIDMAGKKDNGNQKSYSKKFLNDYNFSKDDLIGTKWFRGRISELLSRFEN
ncbi:MAG TPA: hypothetical protein DCG77_06390 [Sphingobacterium sp.]|nr:hypothetical protein [Sphingobacterium sp.]